MSDVYDKQQIYSDGFRAGYAQAIGDADEAIKSHGDDRLIRYYRRDVLALASIPFDPHEVEPTPDWTQYSVSELTATQAWSVVKKWISGVKWEEETFGHMKDEVMIDGVMNAGKVRALMQLFKIPAVASQ
jgi:hypothetical protein